MKLILILSCMIISCSIFANNLNCQKKDLIKAQKQCKAELNARECRKFLSKDCQSYLDLENLKLKNFSYAINKSLVSGDLKSEEVINNIKAKIKYSYNSGKLLFGKKEARLKKIVQQKVLKVFNKMTKNNPEFLTKTLANGLTVRESYMKVQTKEFKSNFADTFQIALKDYRELKKSGVTTSFQRVLSSAILDNNTIYNTFAGKQNLVKSRNIASFGLVVYGCANELEKSLMHLLVFGYTKCTSGNDSIKELVFGPGLAAGAGSLMGFVCIGSDNGFKGIGATAMIGAAPYGSIGTYIGAYGVCAKIEMGAGIGARAGLSYLEIDQEGTELFGALINDI